MSIDYFSLDGEPKVDKSDWFASVSSVSGCFNGTHSVYSLDIDRDTYLLQSNKRSLWKFLGTCVADIICHGYKAISFAQNMLTAEGTEDTEQESIVKVFR